VAGRARRARGRAGGGTVTILDRYWLREFARAASACVAAAVLLFVAVDLVERGDELLQHGVNAREAALYYLLRLPGVFVAVAPVAVLLAVLVTVSVRSRANETAAAFSAGVSVARLAAPLVAGCAAVSLFAFAASEILVPRAEAAARAAARGRIAAGRPAAQFASNRHWVRTADGIASAAVVDPQTGRLQGFSYFELDGAFRPTRRLDARAAVPRGHGRWLLSEGRERRFPGGSADTFREREVVLPATIQGFLESETSPAEMTWSRLASYTREARARGYDVARYEVDLHGKIAYPLLNVIVGFLAVPLALRSPRAGGLWRSVGLGLAAGFACWMVLSASLALGRRGILPPAAAAWLPDLLFAAAGAALFRRLRP